MKQRINLIAAPPAIQPGGYIRQAYADHIQPQTRLLDVSVESRGAGWEIFLSWSCVEAVSKTASDVNLFCDAAALLAPATVDAPLMTMGSDAAGVDGWLWAADREGCLRIQAMGLGTVERTPPPPDVRVSAAWIDQRWGVKFELPDWASLSQRRQIGFAVWQGASAERAGLKSVSPAWIPIP
ncbi:MAG: hypothetical protein R3E82_21510 [Pseudomonadales bacterium]|nr:hypothetical protein [Pseudomonadales bacterium]